VLENWQAHSQFSVFSVLNELKGKKRNKCCCVKMSRSRLVVGELGARHSNLSDLLMWLL